MLLLEVFLPLWPPTILLVRQGVIYLTLSFPKANPLLFKKCKERRERKAYVQCHTRQPFGYISCGKPRIIPKTQTIKAAMK